MKIFHKTLKGVVPVFFLAFFSAFIASSVFTPTLTSDAVNTVTANIESNGYFVNIASDDVEVYLRTTPTGVTSAAKTTVKTRTNAEGGYWLYLSMADPSTSLWLGGDTTRLDGEKVDSIGVTPSEQTVLTDNTWGYAVSADSEGIQDAWKGKTHTVLNSVDSTDETFAGVPEQGTMTLLQKTNEKNVEDATDENYTGLDIYYGVRATMERKSGAYSNTILYTAIADPEGTGTFKLDPASYGRSARYEKMAWNDKLTITTPVFTEMTDLGDVTVTLTGGPKNETYTCGNATLASVESVLTATCTLPAAYAGTYTIKIDIEKFDLHYEGEYKYTVTWDTISAMQEMTPDVCASAGTVYNSQRNAVSNKVPETYLLDIRGANFGLTSTSFGGRIGNALATAAGVSNANNYYRVRKLADGNCWMTENLNLPQTNSQQYWDYDTNITKNVTTSGYGYYTDDDGHVGWTPRWNYITSMVTASGAACTAAQTAAGYCDSDGMADHTYFGNGGEGNTGTSRNRNAVTADTTAATGIAAETQDIGTYYNYGAVTARSGDKNGIGADSGTAPNSICPKGWQLPSGGDASAAKSFQNLMNTYNIGSSSQANSTSSRQYPLSFVFSGDYDWLVRSGVYQLRYQGTSGNWWSLTVTDATGARYLLMGSTVLNPQNNYAKPFGFTVRCVAL